MKRRHNYRPDRYIPIDVWLESPRTKILRGLRRFDWVDNDDLCVAIGVPDWSEDKRRRDAHYQMLRLLVRLGLVERRGKPGSYQYRLKPGVSVDYPADTAVCA